MGCRQPGVQRKEPGLCTEPEDDGKSDPKQECFMPLYKGHIQRTAGDKVQCGAVACQEGNAHQPGKGSGKGVKQILHTGFDRFFRLAVEHHGQGEQRHPFKAEIHRHIVGSKSHTEHGSFPQEEEAVIPVVVLFMLHILKGENTAHEPHESDQPGKEACNGVCRKGNFRFRGECEEV